MATKKKTKKIKKMRTKSKRTGKKLTPARRVAAKSRAPKKLAKKKPAAKRAASKKKATRKQVVVGKSVDALQKQSRKKSQRSEVAFSPKEPGSRSGRLAGDLQGLSNVEGADSESVDELLEEGNAFEADVVAGVEQADGSDEREVHTHEVPEDDVPGEYLDKE